MQKKIFHIVNAAIAPLEGSMDSFTGGVYADGSFMEDSLLDRGKPAPLPEIREHVPDTCIFGGCLFGHFGHFIWESLSRLYAIRQCDTYPILFLSPNDTIFTVQKMFFKTLGIKNEIRLVKVPTSVKNLIYSQPGSSINPLFITDEQLDALACLHFPQEHRGRKIWLSRSKLPSGRIMNEELIEAEIVKRGYEVISPETLPFREQAKLVSTPDLVAGFAGSQFFSMLFAKEIRSTFCVFNRRENIAATIPYALQKRGVEFRSHIFDVQHVSGDRASAGADFAHLHPERILDILK
jgi:capsular polysaccharide biosynthesis protein